MLKFYSKVIRVNEMGNKYYVEVKCRGFVPNQEAPEIDSVDVKVFDTAEAASEFLDSQQ